MKTDEKMTNAMNVVKEVTLQEIVENAEEDPDHLHEGEGVHPEALLHVDADAVQVTVHRETKEKIVTSEIETRIETKTETETEIGIGIRIGTETEIEIRTELETQTGEGITTESETEFEIGTKTRSREYEGSM